MMKAVGWNKGAFQDLELPEPAAKGRDLLVRVKAVSVNPVDVKQRMAKKQAEDGPHIFGWDAAGVVEQAGDATVLFKPGDEVWYAGSIARPGCNSALHLVDERIVGHKPKSLSFVEAAALPLTSITAWEAMFERCGIRPEPARNAGKSLLILGGAGGVGSIATQIAHQVGGLQVIATASRPETIQWCKNMGASHVINHRKPLKDELGAIGVPGVHFILCCNSLEQYVPQFADIIQPQGKVCSIIRMKDEQPLQLNALFAKSAGFEFELMFTRPVFQTDDMQQQHELLERVSQLVDQRVLRTTLHDTAGDLNAANLAKAHAMVESGEMIGKLVLSLP